MFSLEQPISQLPIVWSWYNKEWALFFPIYSDRESQKRFAPLDSSAHFQMLLNFGKWGIQKLTNKKKSPDYKTEKRKI